MDNTLKICIKCKVEKDLTEFSSCKKSKDKVRNQCKECDKTYYERNKETIRVYQNEYSKNLDKKVKYIYNQKYYNLEYHRKYQAKNKEKIAKYMKEYIKNKKL